MSLQSLADRLAMTDSAYPSKVKENLRNAHRELMDSGFLRSVRYDKRAGEAWVCYAVAPKSAWNRIAAKATGERKPEFPENPLVVELASRGVTRDAAADLVERCGEKAVAEQIEAFDFLVRQNNPQLLKNPAGYLRCAIEGNFAIPPGFVSKADRERKRQEQEAAERRKIEAKEAEDRAERETFERCEGIWRELADETREEIDAEVFESLRRLNPQIVRTLEKERAEGRESIAHWTYIAARNKILAERDWGTGAPDAQQLLLEESSVRPGTLEHDEFGG